MKEHIKIDAALAINAAVAALLTVSGDDADVTDWALAWLAGDKNSARAQALHARYKGVSARIAGIKASTLFACTLCPEQHRWTALRLCKDALHNVAMEIGYNATSEYIALQSD